MNRFGLALIICVVLLATTVIAAEPQGGVMNADSKVFSDAKADAPSVGQLAKGAEVKITERNGGWMKVQGNSLTGWVKSLTVKRNAGGANVGDLAGVVTGRGSSGQLVSTSGTRGLDADTLKSAKFNQSELDKMETFKVDNKNAQEFAKSGGLDNMSLSYPGIVK